MTTERIKEIQDKTAHPDSISVQQALLKVWNECEQEKLRLHNVVNRRELLLAFSKWFIKEENIKSTRPDTYVDDFLESQ